MCAMNEKLLPCPFCGLDCSSFVVDQGGKWGRLEPTCLEVRTKYDETENAPWKKEAIKNWNTRKND